LTIWKLYNCKRTAILNGWIETKLKGSPAKEWYKISLQLLDNQSAIGNPNSSTSCKSVSNGESLQQAIRNPNNKLLGILRTYKETMNKGDYEEGEEARSSSEELSLSSSSRKPNPEREENLSDSKPNPRKEKRREELASLDGRDSISPTLKEGTALKEKEIKEDSTVPISLDTDKPIKKEETVKDDTVPMLKVNTALKEKEIKDDRDINVIVDKLFNHINTINKSMSLPHVESSTLWYKDIRGIITDNNSIQDIYTVLEFIKDNPLLDERPRIRNASHLRKCFKTLLGFANSNPDKSNSKEEQKYFNAVKANTQNNSTPGTVKDRKHIPTKYESERAETMKARAQPTVKTTTNNNYGITQD
jgi:hypothetical protein